MVRGTDDNFRGDDGNELITYRLAHCECGGVC